MHLSRRIKIQLAIFAVVALVFGLVLVFGYIKLPAMFGVGRYTVTMELPARPGSTPPATSPIAAPRWARWNRLA